MTTWNTFVKILAAYFLKKLVKFIKNLEHKSHPKNNPTEGTAKGRESPAIFFQLILTEITKTNIELFSDL